MRMRCVLLFVAVFAYGCGPKTSDSLADVQDKLEEPTGRIAELVMLLKSDNRQTAFDAATELGNMGSSATSAIPALVDIGTFNEQGTYKRYPSLAAGKALSKIKPEAAVPYLAKALQAPEKRYWAARILGEFGAIAEPAIPGLVDAIRTVIVAQTSDERDASAQAAAALAKIRPRGLSALIGEMGHDNSKVRYLAVWATPRGIDGKPAIETLAETLSDVDPDIRTLAAHALADIGPEAKHVLTIIRLSLDKERNPRVVGALLQAIDSIETN